MGQGASNLPDSTLPDEAWLAENLLSLGYEPSEARRCSSSAINTQRDRHLRAVSGTHIDLALETTIPHRVACPMHCPSLCLALGLLVAASSARAGLDEATFLGHWGKKSPLVEGSLDVPHTVAVDDTTGEQQPHRARIKSKPAGVGDVGDRRS